jgi:hypothetical protein
VGLPSQSGVACKRDISQIDEAILSMWSALGTNKGRTRRVANPKKEGPEIPGLPFLNNAADDRRS